MSRLDADRGARPTGPEPAPTRRRLPRINATWGVSLILAGVAYIPLLLTKPGVVDADTKQYLFIDPGRLIQSAASMWDPNNAMGTVTHQNIGYLFPMGPFFWIFQEIGVPVWVAQRIWTGSLLFSAGMGMVFLIRTLAGRSERRADGRLTWARGVGWPAPAVFVAALAYMISPYLLQNVSRSSAILLPWAGLPWMVALVMRALRAQGWRHPALFALVVALTGGVNATALIYAAIAPVLWFPYAVWVLRQVSLRRAAVTLAKVGGLSLLVSAWWIAGLAVESGYGLNTLAYTETVQAVSRTGLPFEILRGLGYWYFYGTDGIGPWLHPSIGYTQWAWELLVSFAVPTLAFLAGVLIRWRYRLYFAVLIFVGVAIGVGVAPYDSPSPVGALFKAFSVGSTAGLALRSVDRAGPLAILGISVYLGAAIEAVSRSASVGRALAVARSSPSRLGRLVPSNPGMAATVIAVLCTGLIAADNYPLWTGGFVDSNLSRSEQLPSYWYQAAKYLDSQGDATRVLEEPGQDFANYRWGGTVDDILPGLMTRPDVERQLTPFGTAGSADLLMALDRRLQEGIYEPSTLAPLARLMGVGDVVLRSDLQYERYRTPRPRPTWALFNPPPAGLSQPATFGPPVTAKTSVPLTDEITLGTPASDPEPPAVAVFGVNDPRTIIRDDPAQQPLIVAGNGDGLVDAAATGALDTNQAVLYQADLDKNKSEFNQAMGAGADLVLTDTNRKREYRWGTVRENAGYTEQAGEHPLVTDPSANTLPLFPGVGDNAYTVTQDVGVASVQASDYGNPNSFTPGNRAALAIDGDQSTAWEVGAFTQVEGKKQYLQIKLNSPVTTNRINLVQPLVGPNNRFITNATLRFDNGPGVPITLDQSSRTSAGQTVTFPTRTFKQLDIQIDNTNFGMRANYEPASGVGFAEVNIGGGPNGVGTLVHNDEITRLPTDLLKQAGPSSINHQLEITLTRLRKDPAEPYKPEEEQNMVRSFSLPGTRSFSLSGTAAIADTAPDNVIDSLLGRPPSGITVTSSGHLAGDLSARAQSALDGDPSTFWSPGIGDQVGQWLQVQLPAPTTVDHLNLQVVADGHHSVPTSLSIQGDGQPPVTVNVPPVQDGTKQNSTVSVPVSFPAITASTFKVSVAGTRQETTKDYFNGLPDILPVGIAELGMPGVTLPPLNPTVQTGCRTDLMTVDGKPVGLQVQGSSSAASGGQELQITPCGPGASGLSLGSGNHIIRTVAGKYTGIDLDRLVLGSAAGGSPLAISPTGQVPTPTVGTTGPQGTTPTTHVVSQNRTSAKVSVDVPPAKAPFWLVLGQSVSSGWTAKVKGGPSLGTPKMIDGYANGWYVQPRTAGTLTVNLAFAPQRGVDVALILSAAGLLLCLILSMAWLRPWRVLSRRGRGRGWLLGAQPIAAAALPGDESGLPIAVALPLQPELASPLASPGRRLSRRAGVSTTLAAALVAGLVIGPLAAPVVGVAVALVVVRPGLRWLLTVGAVGGLAVASAYIVELQVHYGFPTFLDWPQHFYKVAGLAWVAVAFLLADAVLEYLRSRRRQS